jgi:hypothetical protein
MGRLRDYPWLNSHQGRLAFLYPPELMTTIL